MRLRDLLKEFTIVERHLLLEKQIIIKGTQGKNYGNIIILAGGGGSGKGFASTHFLEGDLYKVRDIDWYKEAFIKLSKLKNKYPELQKLNLTTPADVTFLHDFVSKKRIKDKTLDYLMRDIKQTRLPNIIFDLTFQWSAKVIGTLENLIKVGYNPKDMNLVWVLTDYKIAVAQNKSPERERIVPDNILLKSHEGAAINMHKLITKGIKGMGRSVLDGGIYVILGGAEHTVFWTDKKGDPITTKVNADTYKKLYGKDPPPKFLKPQPVIKDFKYLQVKEKGKPMTPDKNVRQQLHQWITSSIPRCLSTAHIWSEKALVRDVKGYHGIKC